MKHAAPKESTPRVRTSLGAGLLTEYSMPE